MSYHASDWLIDYWKTQKKKREESNEKMKNKVSNKVCKDCGKSLFDNPYICDCPMSYRDLLKAEIEFLYHYGIPHFHVPIILNSFKMFREERRKKEMEKWKIKK